MKVRFWGTRGSIPTPGPETVRYGGNTACIEIQADDDHLVILDAGSGIRTLGLDLLKRGKKPIEATIMISHTHWDHIQGFPFFVPAFIPGNSFTVCGCGEADMSLDQIVKGQMKSAYFPVDLNDMPAEIAFHELHEGSFNFSGVEVDTMFVNHPGLALAYKIRHNGKTVVYASDNEPYPVEPEEDDRYKHLKFHGKSNRRIMEFAKGADLLIHDSQYTPEEYSTKIGWGHSPYDYAVEIAATAGVKRMVFFHHDPLHNDDFLDDLEKTIKADLKKKNPAVKGELAVEGREISL